jgi:hypothetical protein
MDNYILETEKEKSITCEDDRKKKCMQNFGKVTSWKAAA